jgi:hypothetical protein
MPSKTQKAAVAAPIVGMSAADATAAIQARIAEMEARANPANKTYYPFSAVTVGSTTLNVYTGTPVTQPIGEAAPKNASAWPVPEATNGLAYYMDANGGWVPGLDIRTMTLATMQSLALSDATNNFNQAVIALQGDYSDAERNSWTKQIAEANEVIDGTNNGTNTPLLSALSSARGVDLKTLANSVIAKSNDYNAAYGKLLAEFQTARDKIADAKDFSDLPALTLNSLVTNYQ